MFQSSINYSRPVKPLNWSPNLIEMVQPRPLVICGPSGCGKSTLINRLMAEFGDYLGYSISHTTRKPRLGEVNGREYHFVERHVMEKAIDRGEFIEYAEFSGNIYGTSKKSVKEVQANGKICILDVEIEGVKNLKKSDLKPKLIFIRPPSMDILEKRLRERGTESNENIERRLQKSHEELAYGETPGNFDLVITNDDIDAAYRKLRDFITEDIEALKKTPGV